MLCLHQEVAPRAGHSNCPEPVRETLGLERLESLPHFSGFQQRSLLDSPPSLLSLSLPPSLLHSFSIYSNPWNASICDWPWNTLNDESLKRKKEKIRTRSPWLPGLGSILSGSVTLDKPVLLALPNSYLHNRRGNIYVAGACQWWDSWSRNVILLIATGKNFLKKCFVLPVKL